MVYSPLSIHTVLSLIAAGAKGHTKDQLLSFLNSKSTNKLNTLASDLLPRVFINRSPSGGPYLSFANGLWVDKSLTIKPSFKEVVDCSYKATVNQVDFQTKANEARVEVNSWAEKETDGLIKEFLRPGSVDRMTTLIFANELGRITLKQGEQNFHLLDGISVQATFMTRNADQIIKAFDGFKVLKLPYKQGDDKTRNFSIYVILPDAKDEIGFASKVLKDLGLVLPFTSNVTEMLYSTPAEDAYISGILHEFFIKVNEDGTEVLRQMPQHLKLSWFLHEAAAISAVVLLGSSLSTGPPPQKMDFVADHTFIFLIREENTKTVHHVGHVLNPLAG
ncbi:unnamed protein product [Malus baccata var. baccata]